MGRLHVDVIAARDLRAADWGGKSDPYAVITLDGQKYRTKHVNKTLSPQWNESFEFDNADPQSMLHVQVFDKDAIGRDDSLGVTTVTLGTLFQGRESDLWLPLQKGKGEVNLKITALNFGQQPPQQVYQQAAPYGQHPPPPPQQYQQAAFGYQHPPPQQYQQPAFGYQHPPPQLVHEQHPPQDYGQQQQQPQHLQQPYGQPSQQTQSQNLDIGEGVISLDHMPKDVDDFVSMRDHYAVSPFGAAAMFVLAMLIFSNVDEELGYHCLINVLHVDELQSSRTAKYSYKGFDMKAHVKGKMMTQVLRRPHLARAYIVGAKPENGYQLPNWTNGEPIRVETWEDQKKGTDRIFIGCSGTTVGRHITAIRNDNGIYKISKWVSLTTGVTPPPKPAVKDML